MKIQKLKKVTVLSYKDIKSKKPRERLEIISDIIKPMKNGQVTQNFIKSDTPISIKDIIEEVMRDFKTFRMCRMGLKK